MSVSPLSLSNVASRTTPIDRTASVHEIRERERFNWLAGRLKSLDMDYEVESLAELVTSEPKAPGQREKALVALALNAGPRAMEALEELDGEAYGESFQRLYRVAIREARQRYRRKN